MYRGQTTLAVAHLVENVDKDIYEMLTQLKVGYLLNLSSKRTSDGVANRRQIEFEMHVQ